MTRKAIAMAICLFALTSCGEYNAVSDEEAIATFRAHQAIFQSIAKMLEEDIAQCTVRRDDEEKCDILVIAKASSVFESRVSAAYEIDSRTGPKGQLSVGRVEEYIKMTNRIGLKETFIEGYEGVGEVSILYHRSGFVTGGTTRAYKFRPQSPVPLYDSLKIPLPENNSTQNVFSGYRAIGNGWYLYVHHN